MKILIAFVLSVLFFSSYAQEERNSFLTVNGQGQTVEEATQMALRNAIEQTYGTYISSKTEILNDAQVKDEIVSVSNGNIRSYKLVSQNTLPNGIIAVSVYAEISISKLTNFCEKKGIKIEFESSVFMANVLQNNLNEKNEIISTKNLLDLVKSYKGLFEVELNVKEPVLMKGTKPEEKYAIEVTAGVKPTQNFFNLSNYILKNLESLSLGKQDASNLLKLGKSIYPVTVGGITGINTKENQNFSAIHIMLRTEEARMNVQNIFSTMIAQSLEFHVVSNIHNLEIKNKEAQLKELFDNLYHLGPIDGGASYYYKKIPLIYTFGLPENNTESAYNAVGQNIVCNNYINQNFAFVSTLRENMICQTRNIQIWEWNSYKTYTISECDPGLIISFIRVVPHKELINVVYVDELILDDLKKTTEYSIENVAFR
jgi:hypothetical protein